MKSISEALVDKIIENLIESNSIDVTDAEVYKFGVETTLLKVLHYTSYFVIALCMNKFFDFAIFFAVFYTFRRSTGGYHAQTRIGCYLFSCAVIFLSIFATDLNINWRWAAIISALDIIVLLVLSPIQNSNRNLDTEEIEYFRHRLRILSVIFVMVYIAAIGLRLGYLVRLYTIGLTMDTLLAILGKMQKTNKEKINEKNK